MSDFILTESALSGSFKILELVASLADMVWLMHTVHTKILLALVTSDSVLAHVLCCFPKTLKWLIYLTLRVVYLRRLFDYSRLCLA